MRGFELDEIPTLSRLLLHWAPAILTVVLSRRFGWTGLGLALVASFALFQTIANLQGEGWSLGRSIESSTNPLVRTTYVGAFWGWIMGFICATVLFVSWCKTRLNPANQ